MVRTSTSQVAPTAPSPDDPQAIRLKDPALAAFLAWLVPGLGHLYQGRTAKGVLFSATILITFFGGLFLGEGRVVYASWSPVEKRLPYVCQLGVGLPAMPALVQAYRVRNGKPPITEWMAPVRDRQELHRLHHDLHRYFELGTVYTMIAGLLNILVIYDAWGGPAYVARDDRKRRPPSGQPPDETDDTVPGAT